MRSKLDLLQLRIEIRQIKWGNKLYIVLKDELSKIGHWKNKSRGNPKKAWQASNNRNRNVI